MIKIECKAPFLHGRERFEQGDVRSVSEEDGAYFIAQGWAAEPGTELPIPLPLATDGDASLVIDNVTQGQEASNG